eukprot:8786864-Prorocentrum_lima.AAC.1
MTSSLVGSEMCIRDRNRADEIEDLHTKQAEKLSKVGIMTMPALHIQQAVSYTHLTLPTICSV